MNIIYSLSREPRNFVKVSTRAPLPSLTLVKASSPFFAKTRVTLL